MDFVVPVAVRTDVLESAVLISLAEPFLEPLEGGERSSEVVAVTDADTAAVLVISETVSEAVPPIKEPAMISTR